MKLRNKKTGKIVCTRFCGITYNDDDDHLLKMWLRDDDNEYEYNSLAELNEEWEDYEGPKGYWWISPVDTDVAYCVGDVKDEMDQYNKEIGNYFETREEAEKAVEKLKAWKRLKDRNLRFNLNYSTSAATINHKDVIMCRIEAYFDDKWEEDNMKAEEDLYLLLGGEE